MPNKNLSQQVDSETVEPYRGIMISRTLAEGTIVAKGYETPPLPRQTFYAIAQASVMPNAFKDGGKGDERVLWGIDLEAVRALIDRYAPGSGVVQSVAPAA